MNIAHNDSPIQAVQASIFLAHTARERNRILVNRAEMADVYDHVPLLCPIVADTEYSQPDYDPTTTGLFPPRHGVTLQMKGVQEDSQPMIWVYPEQVEYLTTQHRSVRPGHGVFTSGFAGVEFLQAHGYDVTLDVHPIGHTLDALPAIQFVFYAHFALAEYGMIAQGEFRQHLLDLMRYNHVSMGRRLRCQVGEGVTSRDYLRLPWRLTVNGCAFRVELCMVDTLAAMGHLSYAAFLANVGISLSQKETMHKEGWITRMHDAYSKVPELFDEYASDDLHVYEAFRRYAGLLAQVYAIMGLSAYYRGEPRLTIGATTRDLIEATILNHADIAPDDKERRKDFMQRNTEIATAKTLIGDVATTTCLLAKVDGGRCRSNQPTTVTLAEVLCDIDLKSCYGEGLRSQLYPFGRPMIMSYPMEQRVEHCATLREFLKAVGYRTAQNQLVYGLWHARVSTPEGYRLQYAQDFLPSWIEYALEDMRQAIWHKDVMDSDDPELGLDVKSGTSKIFTHQISDAVITSDFLDWLFEVCSPGQQAELLDHLHVRAAMLYPACEQVESLAELARRQETHNGHTKVRLSFGRGTSRVRVTHAECYAWYAVPMGELYVDTLLEQRALHPKSVNKSLNELFKLLVNASYGDMTSPYFSVANPTIGNNITMRARAAEWYAEKGLHAVQSITDGGVFPMSRVVYPHRQKTIPAHKFVGLYRERHPHRNRQIHFAPLGGCDHIALSWQDEHACLTLTRGTDTTVLEGDAVNEWINTTAMEHLQALFPHVRVLHGESTVLRVDNPQKPTQCFYEPRQGLYSFEAKGCFDRAVFHSAANYALWQGDRLAELKMRSYEKRKRHHTTTLDKDGRLIADTLYDTGSPASVFLPALLHPDAVPRQMTFVKSAILTPGDWRRTYESTWQYSPLTPGDSYYKSGLLRECSLSQYTFESKEQRDAFEKAAQSLKRKCGEGFEVFFRKKDGSLNYTKMVQTLDNLIALGQMDPLALLDPYDHRTRDCSMAHPAWNTLQETKAHLRRWQQLGDGGKVEESPSEDIKHAQPRAELYD